MMKTRTEQKKRRLYAQKKKRQKCTPIYTTIKEKKKIKKYRTEEEDVKKKIKKTGIFLPCPLPRTELVIKRLPLIGEKSDACATEQQQNGATALLQPCVSV